jgi:peroxiredoxin Q/BCP
MDACGPVPLRFPPVSKLEIKLRVGDKAPDFTAETNGGQTVTLSELTKSGKQVVLYFYPRDNTPGCTKEACGFRDSNGRFKRKGAVVLGVSKDSVKSHDNFVEKFSLPFLLIADAEVRLAKAYGVWGEKKFMGRQFMGMHRVTFLIGKDAQIRRIWSSVKPDTHAEEVLAAL